MSASTREEIVAVLDAVDDAQDQLCELTFDALTTPELLRVMERLERRERRSRSVRHVLINQLRARAGEDDLGGKLPTALAERLRITKAESPPLDRRGRGPRAAPRADRGTAAAQAHRDRRRPTRRDDRRRAHPGDP